MIHEGEQKFIVRRSIVNRISLSLSERISLPIEERILICKTFLFTFSFATYLDTLSKLVQRKNTAAVTVAVCSVLLQQLTSGSRSDLGSPIKSDEPDQSRRSLTSVQSTTPVVSFVSGKDSVHLENENKQAILERRQPDNIRQILDGLLRPTPIVDGIKEEQKYGNPGDRFGFGRAFINSYESFSNFLNAIVDVSVKSSLLMSQPTHRAEFKECG